MLNKKLIFILSVLIKTNIFGATAPAKTYEETSKIHERFCDLLKLEDFDAIKSFIMKNIDYINEPGDYNQKMINIVGFRANLQETKAKDECAFKVIKLLLRLGADFLNIYSYNRTIFHDTPDLAIKAIEEIEKERKELSDYLLSETQLPKEIIDVVQSYQSRKPPQLMGNPILNLPMECMRTPLHYQGCFGHNRPEGIKLLIKYRADLEAKDANLETPIFYALQGRPEVLKAMIELKADLTYKTYWHGIALDHAIKMKWPEAAQILRDAMAQKEKFKKAEKKASQCCVIQ